MTGLLNPVHSDALPTAPALDWRDGQGAGGHAWVPEELYREILERMPVICVDTLVVRGGEALLTRRTQEPQAGSLWLQGGRMRKGEQLTAAAMRTAEQESGLTLTLSGVLGTFSTVFDASAHGTPPPIPSTSPSSQSPSPTPGHGSTARMTVSSGGRWRSPPGTPTSTSSSHWRRNNEVSPRTE